MEQNAGDEAWYNDQTVCSQQTTGCRTTESVCLHHEQTSVLFLLRTTIGELTISTPPKQDHEIPFALYTFEYSNHPFRIFRRSFFLAYIGHEHRPLFIMSVLFIYTTFSTPFFRSYLDTRLKTNTLGLKGLLLSFFMTEGN